MQLAREGSVFAHDPSERGIRCFWAGVRRVVVSISLCATVVNSGPLDSIFEPMMRPFSFLPDYYLRFGISTFALHQNAFMKRQYLAEPHPELEFCFLSYKDLIASVWQVDFQFGLGEVPGNNVFTVLNVAFGINPTLELRLRDLTITGGMAHRCFHEVDRSDFPVVWYNKLFVDASSPNARLNTYWRTLSADSAFSHPGRFAWSAGGGYYLKDLFGLASPDKLNGNNPLIWEASTVCRYAVRRQRSWVFVLRGETTAGVFDREEAYRVVSRTSMYWKQSVGVEALFTRGARGGCLYLMYHLDDLPSPPNGPSFALGNSRFSKNGLAQIGVVFFN